ncbi:ABC transporter permease subunit [Variovorax humicola]|uniref:ABC transporter permease subunit n=1 Tax=Variovorax humicola TaxID=1769758 RepID=A0ABU8W4K5_9BURK
MAAVVSPRAAASIAGPHRGSFGFRSLFPISTIGLVLFILVPPLLLLSLSVSERFDLRGGVLPVGFNTDAYVQWSDDIIKAAGASMAVALPTVLLALLLGTPVAYALARLQFNGKAMVIEFVNLPMIFPPIVLGFGLFQLFRSGALPAMPPLLTLIAAHTVVSTPFMIRPLMLAIQRVDPALEEASLSLGASRLTGFVRVVLPMLVPALLTGIALTFARSISDFEITFLLAGGDFSTLPVTIYQAFETGSSRLGAAVAMAGNVFAISVIVVLELVVKKAKWW